MEIEIFRIRTFQWECPMYVFDFYFLETFIEIEICIFDQQKKMHIQKKNVIFISFHNYNIEYEDWDMLNSTLLIIFPRENFQYQWSYKHIKLSICKLCVRITFQHRITRKITILSALIFKFPDIEGWDKSFKINARAPIGWDSVSRKCAQRGWSIEFLNHGSVLR